jgi:putative hydrolases of HD superfamily
VTGSTDGGDVPDDRLLQQLTFLMEADRLKQVERQTAIVGGARRENTAEHSWHLALFALVLAEHADHPVDLHRVMSMVVLHDLVEIDAGDTFAYDEAGHADKEERELAAADRLFGLLPTDQGARLRALWEEYESAETPDGRFAMALDRMQPVMLNLTNQADAWVRHGIDAGRVRKRNEVIGNGSRALWAEVLRCLADAVDAGILHEPAPTAEP